MSSECLTASDTWMMRKNSDSSDDDRKSWNSRSCDTDSTCTAVVMLAVVVLLVLLFLVLLFRHEQADKFVFINRISVVLLSTFI